MNLAELTEYLVKSITTDPDMVKVKEFDEFSVDILIYLRGEKKWIPTLH